MELPFQHKWMVFLALVLTIFSNLLALVGPMISGMAIDAIGTDPGQVDFPSVFWYCLMLIGFYAFSSLLTYILTAHDQPQPARH